MCEIVEAVVFWSGFARVGVGVTSAGMFDLWKLVAGDLCHVSSV